MEYTAEIISSSKFRIKRKQIQGTLMFFTRLLWSYYTEGGKAWKQGLFGAFQVIFTFIVLPVDFVISLFHLALKIIHEITKLLFKILLSIFEQISEKALGTALKYSILIALAIFLYTIILDGTWKELYYKLSELLQSLLLLL